MGPTAADLHISAPLTNLSVASIQNDSVFIARTVFPTVPVQQQSNKYYVYERDGWGRSEVKPRGRSSESAGSGWDLSDDTYYAQVKAVHKDNDDQDYANADAIFDLDREATQWVTTQHLLEQEQTFVDTYMAADVWDAEWQGVNTVPNAGEFTQWDDDDSTPTTDIKNAVLAQAAATGGAGVPNVLVLGAEVYNVLTEHPAIVSRVANAQAQIADADFLSRLFSFPGHPLRVVVPFAVANAAKEGLTEDWAFQHGKNVLLAYAAPNPGIRTPSAGYTFAWTGYTGASALGTRIRRFRIEEKTTTRIEGDAAYDMKVVDTAAGTMFLDAVA